MIGSKKSVFWGWIGVAALAITVLLAGPVNAQDQRRLQVRPLKPAVPPVVVRGANEPGSGDLASYDATAIAVNLKGIALYGDSPPEVVERLNFSGVKVIRGKIKDADRLEKKLKPFLGKPISLRLYAEVREAIFKFYDARGELAVIPGLNQDAAGGVLQIAVHLRRLQRVDVAGQSHYPADLYRKPFVEMIDAPVDLLQLNARGRTLSNPFRHIAEATPNVLENDASLVLKVHDRFPLSIGLGFDNEGVPILGEDRYSLAITTTDPFKLDSILGYRLVTAEDPRKETAHYLTYLLPSPIGYGQSIQFEGIYTASRATVDANGEEFDNQGTSSQATISYALPLPDISMTLSESVSLGFDFKTSDSNFDFGGTTFSKTGTETYQFWLAHNFALTGSEHDWIRAANLANRIVFSPGNFSGKNTDAAFQTIRPNSQAEYVYWRADFSISVELPADVASNIVNPVLNSLLAKSILRISGEVQESSTNLLSAEQVSLGGAQTIRGFDENAVLVDNGFYVRTQLFSPPIASLHSVLRKKSYFGIPVQDDFRIYGFFDYGMGGSKIRSEGEPKSVGLGSVGLGLRYAFNDSVAADVAYGWQVIESNFSDDRTGRWHFNVQVTF